MLVMAGSFSLFGQAECEYIQKNAEELLVKHVGLLASDELQGRKPGTESFSLARDYITSQFQEMGLQPAAENNFLQEFMIPEKVVIDPERNRLQVEELELNAGQGYYPVKYSSNGLVEAETHYVSYAIESEELDRDDLREKQVAGSVAVMEIGSPDGVHPHSAFLAYHDIFTRLSKLKEKGAQAVILVDSENQRKNPAREFKKLNRVGLPVIFVEDEELAMRLISGNNYVKLAVYLEEQSTVTHNIHAYLDNQAPLTVMIGAHYDHLGFGGESSLAPKINKVHNGADDNASGVAGLIELARFLKRTDDQTLREFNYQFIAFSAEEMGLLGSKFYVENVENFDRVSFMFNMDMIGRLREEQLQVNGVGTSPLWEKLIETEGCRLNIVPSASGVGPSDHTSFYYKDVPVLHFFTGTHRDYHKPSDDSDLINYEGIRLTLNYMLSIIRNAPKDEPLSFEETASDNMSAPRFTVTLGVMPDYIYRGNGMRIEAVNEGKPADRAGLKDGDVVVELGPVKVSDMQSYMQALSQFKEGDQAKLKYRRKGKTRETTVQF